MVYFQFSVSAKISTTLETFSTNFTFFDIFNVNAVMTSFDISSKSRNETNSGERINETDSGGLLTHSSAFESLKMGESNYN